MSAIYHQGNRELQGTFDTTRIADRIEEVLVSDEISDHDRAFIESRDMFFLATADDAGLPNCSYKGGEPGFVRVIDQHTVAFPTYDGNGMYLSMANLRINPAVRMLFIDFERGHRMRLNGMASIAPNDPLMTHSPEAQFVVRVRAREVFPDCPRYVHRYELVERSRVVPTQGGAAAVPAWRRGGGPGGGVA